MKMIVLPRADDVTHIALEGRLDSTAVEEIEGLFLEATAGRKLPTVVDLSQIDFMASRGIGMLLASSKRLKKDGHKLVLLQPQQLVDSSLRTTRIDLVMPIAYEFDDAIRLARGEATYTPASSRRESATTGSPPPRSQTAAAPPASAPSELNIVIKNEISALKDLNAEVAQFLEAHGIASRASYAVNLAIDELVTNVIRYAYVDDEPHTIELKLAIQNDQVVLGIVDDGRPFDPRTGPSLDLHADERQVGGLGLILVLDMVDALKYRRTGDQNHVEVRIHRLDEIEASPSVAASDSITTI